MESPFNVSTRITAPRPAALPVWCCSFTNSSRLVPGGKPAAATTVSVTNRGSGSSSSIGSGKSKRSSKDGALRRRRTSGSSGRLSVVELPEVLYRFTDASGNSAEVIEASGASSRISLVALPLINPLASFEERDIDPASSDPLVPMSILAPLPPPVAAALASLESDTGGGSVAVLGSLYGSNASGNGNGNSASMIITTTNSGNGGAVFTYVTRSHDPVTGAAVISPAAAAAALTGLPGGVYISGSDGGDGVAGSFSAGPAAFAAASGTSTSAVDLLAISRTITITRQGPNPVVQALSRALKWRPPNLFEWWAAAAAARARRRGAAVFLPAPHDAAAASAGDTTDGTAEMHSADSSSNVSTDAECTEVTGSTDSDVGYDSDVDGGGDCGSGGRLWDPALLGMIVLAATAATVGGLAAAAAAAAAASASAAAAAASTAALAAPPAPAAATWVQLNPVPGMATEVVAAAVQSYMVAWTELCNQVMEPLSRAFQKWSYAALPVKIAFVLASSAPLVMVFGSLYYFAVGGRPAGQSFVEALYKIHAILNRMPGTNMVRESNAASFLVVNAAFFTGLFTFAIFLGIVSDEVKTTFRSIKTGAYPVRVRDHVLVVNWSHHTIPLLRQFDLARKYAGNDDFFRRPVVLLSDAPKQDMDNEIAERLKSSSLEVITRSGSPAMLRDLATVAAASAHTIIVMHPGGAASHASAEAAKASTAMALAALTASEAAAAANEAAARAAAGGGAAVVRAQQVSGPTEPNGSLAHGSSSSSLGHGSSSSSLTHGGSSSGGRRLPRVLFQMPDEVQAAQDPVTSFTKSSPANISGNMQALSITDASVIDRFTCQAAVQPGMLRIWASVLQHGPHSIKALVVPVPPQLVGSSYNQARRQYADAVLIGVMRANGTNGNCGGRSLHMDLQELDSWELAVGDQLVMFVPARVAGVPSASQATAALFPPAAAAAADRIKRHGGYNAPAKRVIMAGYHWREVPVVASAFSDSAPDNSTVTFILSSFPDHERDGEPELPGGWGSCRIRYVDTRNGSSMLTLRALQDAGIKTADAVVLRPPIQEMERWCAKKPVTARIREADAMVMAGLIQVQDAVIASGRTEPPHVVARLNRYGSTETALRYFEMLSPPQQQPQPQQQPSMLGAKPQQSQPPQPISQSQPPQHQQPQPAQQSQQANGHHHQQQLPQQHQQQASALSASSSSQHPQQQQQPQQQQSIKNPPQQATHGSGQSHSPAAHGGGWLLDWWPSYHNHPREVSSPSSSLSLFPGPAQQQQQQQQQQQPHAKSSQMSPAAAPAAPSPSPATASPASKTPAIGHHHHHHHHHHWWQVWRGILPGSKRAAAASVMAAEVTTLPLAGDPSAQSNSHINHHLREPLDPHHGRGGWRLPQWQGVELPTGRSTSFAFWAAPSPSFAASPALGGGTVAATTTESAAPAPSLQQPQKQAPKDAQKDAAASPQHLHHQPAAAPAATGGSSNSSISSGNGGSGSSSNNGSLTAAAPVPAAAGALPQSPELPPGHCQGHGSGFSLPHRPVPLLQDSGVGGAAPDHPTSQGAAPVHASAAAPTAGNTTLGGGGGSSGSASGATSSPAAAAVTIAPAAQAVSGGSGSAGAAAPPPSSGAASASQVPPPLPAVTAAAATQPASAGWAAGSAQAQAQLTQVPSAPQIASPQPPTSVRQLDGPLAAMQAVMMGASGPALPIGADGSTSVAPQRQQPGNSGSSAAPPLAVGSTSGATASGAWTGAAAAPPPPAGQVEGAAAAAATAATGAAASTTSTGLQSSGAVTAAAGGASQSGSGSSSGGSSGSGNGSGSNGGTAGGSSSSSSSNSSSSASATLPLAPSAPTHDKRPIIRNPEIFLADDLIGALLTQVAAQPSYAQLVSQLITKDGAELYLRSPAVFNIAPGERLSFAELSEATRLLGQVAVGVVRPDGRCCLVPKPHELLHFGPGDQVLVLSDDYRIRRK